VPARTEACTAQPVRAEIQTEIDAQQVESSYFRLSLPWEASSKVSFGDSNCRGT
jgi:hypothetical protein